MKFFIVLLIVGALFACSGFAAMNCSYDATAYITVGEDVKWSCWDLGFQHGKCYSMVLFQEDVLTVYPVPQDVMGVGVVDYFSSTDGLVNAYFKTTDLYEGYNYTFEVLCGEVNGSRTASFSRSIVPVYHDLYAVGYRAVWLKQNAPYIIGFAGLLVFVAVIVVMVRRV